MSAVQKTHVVFDLDDTLYNEESYVSSAFRFVEEIVESAYGISGISSTLLKLRKKCDQNPIQTVWLKHNLPEEAISDCIFAMRAHKPDIFVRDGVDSLLTTLNDNHVRWSILTDGRSITQRQKISALRLGAAASEIYISQERYVSKPEEGAFTQIQNDFPTVTRFVYIGDNPNKDFLAPNNLGWKTIMLRDDGTHIHKQSSKLSKSMYAQHSVDNIQDLYEHLSTDL